MVGASGWMDLAFRVGHVERPVESALGAQALGPVRRQRRPALRAMLVSGIFHFAFRDLA